MFLASSLWYDWFNLHSGSVLTNLVASAIWVVIGWRKLHQVHKHVLHLHDKLDKVHTHLGISDDDQRPSS